MTVSAVSAEAPSFDERVGQNFRELRKRHRLSQHDVANAMTAHGTPMTQQSVTRVERGLRTLKFDEALTFAYLLGVPVSSLAYGTDRGPGVFIAGTFGAAAHSLRYAGRGPSTVDELNERIERLEGELERLARERMQPALV